MASTKKQHFVPQFLLKRFCVGEKHKERIWVLDKLTGKVFQSSARDVGHENKFYQYIDDNHFLDPENLLQKIEDNAALNLSKIERFGKLSRNKGEIISLSYFVAAQILRTPHTRNEMENFRKLVIAKWGADIRVNDDPKTLGEYGPKDSKLASLRIMGDIPNFAKLLQEKVWTLCKAPSQENFIISDNPVTKHNMFERKGRGNLGLRNKGIEIYLPISSKYTLQALCPELSLAAYFTPELSNNYINSLVTGSPVLQKKENVEFLNSLQVIWAERFIYAKTKKQLEMPLDMLSTNPELREGPRVQLN